MVGQSEVPVDRLEAAYRAGVIEEQPRPPPDALAAAPPPTLPLAEPVALRGAVLAPGGAIADGYVVVEGSQIEAVVKTPPRGRSRA
jgi:hypothetical protein